MVPFRMMLMSSASSWTSDRMWLDSRIAAPSLRRSRTMLMNVCSMSGSSPEVGSSRTRILALAARAAMSMTFCRLPLE